MPNRKFATPKMAYPGDNRWFAGYMPPAIFRLLALAVFASYITTPSQGISRKMDLKKKRNLFHLIEWILAIVGAVALAGLPCIRCARHMYQNQFVDATIYGYLIISSIVFLSLCLDEDIPEKTQYGICGTGFVLYTIVALLFVLSIDGTSSDTDIRWLVTCAAAIANAIVYGIEFFWSLLKKGSLD